MYFKKFSEKVIKKLKWYDISLIKTSVLLSTLFLITVWPGLHDLVMSVSWYWYLIAALIVMSPLLKRMFLD